MLSSVQSAKRKYHLGSWQNIAKRKLEWYPYKLSHPKMALNYLTQILKHDNHTMCFGPNGMEHASILSQNKHSFFLKKIFIGCQ
jgi:hypothetical protein